MSIENIYNDIKNEQITFGPHLIQRMWENGISIAQVLDTILTGAIKKKEKDELSHGKFMKYTISKRQLVVAVKDCIPAFVITANKRR
jgi:hypothetical protein